ncbi:uncharacterized protein LOC123547249 [Mercenaria mercenaria]|uniref:uncharacterized protein LOC123547249 n=1 Tax=Mercenaria mercenaria TaxID=6596 RepID=UPI00234ED5AB|nr:uncharacterized protein LOC123547249 [Mercenaria mercenaria]
MANTHYINARIEFDSMPNSELYVNRATVVSNFSESTFCETDFETLDAAQSDRYGDYTNLSKDVSYSNHGVVHDQSRPLNDRCGPLDFTVTSTVLKGKQELKSNNQKHVIYANDAMSQKDRDSIDTAVPRRTRKGNKMIRRISTMPSSVWHEVHGWSRVKTAAIILISFVIGAAVVLATIYAQKFIDTISKGNAELNEENGHGGDNTCKTVTNLNGCKNTIYEKDIKGRSDPFSTNCSKIYKKIINSRLYIFYEDGMSFSEAVDFCHWTVHLKMLEIESSSECKDLQKYMNLNLGKASGYWTGQWNQEGKDTGNEAWPHVQPEDDIIITDRSMCVYLRPHPENCTRKRSVQGCSENIIPVCKC